MNNVFEPQEKPHDWHRADVVAALHKRGWTVTKLAEAHGLSPSTLRSALEKSYPKSERIIANAIGVKPEEIWAERYAKRNYTPILHG